MSNTLQIGQKASYGKTFSKDEVNFYCSNISNDRNLVHFQKDFANNLGFEDCLVPGIMVTSIIGGVLGSTLPGEGTIHLGQTSRFIKPVYINRNVTVEVEVISIREDKPIAILKTTIYNDKNEIAIEGEAAVKFRIKE
jgi:acyl dehydratase